MKKLTRKNFLFTGIGLATMATFFKWKRKPEKKIDTMKFLTQDGKLVEIDVDKLPAVKRMASKENVQTWIKK